MSDLTRLLEDDMGLVAIAVGTAEGTRTPVGQFTKAYRGHTDLGNGRNNQGSFSYQGAAANPKIADILQLSKIRQTLLPIFERHWTLTIPLGSDKILLFVTACDVFTQSEAACLGVNGFLDQLKTLRDDRTLIDIRVDSFFDPVTNTFNAPGFGNDPNAVRADQIRRQECIDAAISIFR